MALEDKLLGGILITVASTVFTYYTVWILVLPFVDVGHPFQAYFPDRYYAVAIPSILLIVGITAITSLIGLVMTKANQGKAKDKAEAIPLVKEETKKQQ